MNAVEIGWIAAVAFGASLLTFFSGFGLGSLLTPAFLFFFPPDVAIALTAVVHLLNNVFKFGLMRTHLDWSVFHRFGWTALFGSLLGAALLLQVGQLAPIPWIGGRSIPPLKPLIGGLLMVFSLFEMGPQIHKGTLPRAWLPWGGGLSGFFGGFSGHQGALRSVFLLRVGLSPAAYVATGTAIALAVDLARIPLYGMRFGADLLSTQAPVLMAAVGSATAGAVLGKQMLKKLKVQWLQVLVGLVMMGIGLGLFLGRL
ncbi:TSUP family transporter [bacterium]|nr:TSUP family transporter [bacterium]